MGRDAPAPTPSESTAQMMQAFIENFPEYLNVQLDQIPNAENALLRNQRDFSPQLTQVQLDQSKEFQPQFNQLGDQINRDSALFDAETGQMILDGPGKDLVSSARETADIFDKEFFDTRSDAADQISKLFESIDVGGLSGSESAEIERGLNRSIVGSGNEGTGSNINTLAAANTFGSALEAKRGSLRSALDTASKFLSTANSGVDTLQIASGRPSRSNQGAGVGQGLQANQATQPVFGAGSQLLNQTGSLTKQSNDINSQRRDSLDRVTGVMGSLPNVS
tara:strand:- start:308 stop:1144 length:837 start_codon:yes stop_codon:yes gene_type:complete